MEPKTIKDNLPGETSIEERSLKILLVEDNPGDVVLVRELLRTSGIDFSLENVGTLKETLMRCLAVNFDIILLDLGLPDSTGVETLKKINVFNTRSPVVVMTGLDDEDAALESLRQGAQDYLVKNRLTADNIIRGIKYGIERKKIQDLLKRNAIRFSMLSSTTSAINECEDITSIFSTACRNISELLNKAGVAGIKSESPVKIYSSGTELFEPWFSQIEKLMGIDLNKSLVHNNDGSGNVLKNLFIDGRLHRIGRLDPLGQKSVQQCLIANTNFNWAPPEVHAIGFTRNEMIYGGAIILSTEPVGGDDVNIVETIGNQVSLSLHRKAIEADLKESEDRYRKLSRELEVKVKERTHDLESVNYHLNQELIERHLAEEALRKSEVTLRELNATKDKFFSIIAHDLKNPFTCLLGSTEVLNENLDSMDTPNIRGLVQVINDSARSGYNVLQNLLVWSRSQTGMITYSPEKFSLKALIDQCVSDMKVCYSRKDVTITSEVKGNMDIFADWNMILTILRNLADNAVKFTPEYGTVTIAAVNDADELTISVIDTGIGIPEDNIGDLFRLDKKFTRPGTKKEQGTGLGLKICKEFAEMQGGTIKVRSTVKMGSEFIVTIPLRKE
jgi:signal transduction histidine kinase/CheY-like chemotaxis protein